MPTSIHARVRAAHAGTNPSAICQMASGWVVMGDWQLLGGYVLLLSDPVVPHLNALSGSQRNQFLQDMTIIGDALISVMGAIRCNYEILGNLDPALHAHIFPRFVNEPDERRHLPPMLFSAEDRSAIPFDPSVHATLMRNIAEAIRERIG